jgi:hypothetical protein
MAASGNQRPAGLSQTRGQKPTFAQVRSRLPLHSAWRVTLPFSVQPDGCLPVTFYQVLRLNVLAII